MYYETKGGDDELCCLFDEDNEEKKPRKRRRNEASILEQENDIDRLSNSRPKRAATIHKTETSSGQRRIDEFLSNKRSPKKNNPKNLNVNSVLPPPSVSQNERCPICDRLMSIDILETHTQTCIIRNTTAAKELIEKSKQRAKMEADAKETLFGRKISGITRARRGGAAPPDPQNSSKSKFIFAPPPDRISDILFPQQRPSTSEILVTPQRTSPRKKPNVKLVRLDSETTTCPTCGMQMTVTRLENQHKKTCSKSLISS